MPDGGRNESQVLSATKGSLHFMPKTTQDSLFFNATSFDYDGKVRSRDQLGSLEDVYEVSLPTGSAMVPLLTHKSVGYNQQFYRKVPTDWDMNRANVDKHMAGSPPGGGLDIPMRSLYTETIGRRMSRADRRGAMRPPDNPDAARGPHKGGQLMVSRSSTQTAHAEPNRSFRATGEEWRGQNNLVLCEPATDFFDSRYRMEHCSWHRASTAPHPQTAAARRRAGRRRPGSVPAGLEDLMVAMRGPERSASSPSGPLVAPLSLVGSRIS